MSRIKGPRDGKFLRSDVSGKSLQKHNLKEERCVLLVSVAGNKYCTDNSNAYFTSSLLNLKERFKEVVVLIVDDVQKHNLKVQNPSSNLQELEQMAKQLGDDWWVKHESSLLMSIFQQNHDDQPLTIGTTKKSLKGYKRSVVSLSNEKGTPPSIFNGNVNEKIQQFNELAKPHGVSVIRWRDWVKNIPLDSLEEAEKVCRNPNLPVYQGIQNSAKEFAKRHTESTDESFQGSVDFLTEETPRLALGCKYNDCRYMAYAGDEIEAFEEGRNYFLKDDDYMNWLQINFYRLKEENVDVKAPENQIILTEYSNSNPEVHDNDQENNIVKIYDSTINFEVNFFKNEKGNSLKTSTDKLKRRNSGSSEEDLEKEFEELFNKMKDIPNEGKVRLLSKIQSKLLESKEELNKENKITDIECKV